MRELAGPTGYSLRQLRRLTMQSFGVTPVEIFQTERLLFAKKLLHETTLPMTEIALAVGFRSLRRFNALFRARYRLAPTALRRRGAASALGAPGRDDGITLRLVYRPPLAWREMLAYLTRRAVPGVEWVSPERGSYGRTVALGEKTGWVLVTPCPREHALEVRTPANLVDTLWPLLSRLRALFDLDANPACIDEHLRTDPILARSVLAHPGLRVPGCWDVFELAVRAVLGQQVSVAGATTLAGRLAARFGERPWEDRGRRRSTGSPGHCRPVRNSGRRRRPCEAGVRLPGHRSSCCTAVRCNTALAPFRPDSRPSRERFPPLPAACPN